MAKKAKDEERGEDYKADETIRGGKYVSADGTLKNAHGQPIDEDGKVTDGSSPPAVDIPAQEAPPT